MRREPNECVCVCASDALHVRLCFTCEEGESVHACTLLSVCFCCKGREGLSANEQTSASQQVNGCHVRPLWHCKSRISMSARSRITAAELSVVECSLWKKRVVSGWCGCERNKDGSVCWQTQNEDENGLFQSKMWLLKAKTTSVHSHFSHLGSPVIYVLFFFFNNGYFYVKEILL